MKHWIHHLFSAILGMLGFSSCAFLPQREEYGTPYATFKLNAEATDEEGNPVEGIRVVTAPNGSERKWDNDTLYTDKTGKASLDRLKYSWPDTDKMTVVFDDVDGEEHDSFSSVSLDKNGLEIQKTAEGGGTWDKGSYTITAKAKLTKK